jgi:hypothetical protein
MKILFYKSDNKLIKKFIILKLIKNKQVNYKKIVDILKTLKIILKYFLNNKKILFLGTSKKISYFFKFVYQFKNIAYLPSNMWLKGLITNSFVFKALYFSKKKQLSKFLLNFKFYYDLIISLNCYTNNELLKLVKQPIIFIKYDFNNNSSNFSVNNFYFFLIYQIFLKFKYVN